MLLFLLSILLFSYFIFIFSLYYYFLDIINFIINIITTPPLHLFFSICIQYFETFSTDSSRQIRWYSLQWVILDDRNYVFWTKRNQSFRNLIIIIDLYYENVLSTSET